MQPEAKIFKNLIHIEFMREPYVHGWIRWPVPVVHQGCKMMFQDSNNFRYYERPIHKVANYNIPHTLLSRHEHSFQFLKEVLFELGAIA